MSGNLPSTNASEVAKTVTKTVDVEDVEWNNYFSFDKSMIEKDADVNKVYDDGHTPLFYACKDCNIPVIKSLIKKGANVNAEIKKEDKLTPLYYVCANLVYEYSSEYFEIAKILIDNGAIINNKNDKSIPSCLYIACCKGKYDLVKFLLDNGADPNERMLLQLTCMHGKPDIAKLLIEYGACINNDSHDVETLLCLYSAYCDIEYDLAKYLLDSNVVNDEQILSLRDEYNEKKNNIVELILKHSTKDKKYLSHIVREFSKIAMSENNNASSSFVEPAH